MDVDEDPTDAEPPPPTPSPTTGPARMDVDTEEQLAAEDIHAQAEALDLKAVCTKLVRLLSPEHGACRRR